MAKMKNKKIHVLDHGYVSLIEQMPHHDVEQFIARAARVSYVGNESEIRSTEKDEKLVKYLWKNGHTSPFEQVVFQFQIKAPLFVVQHLLRHRTARINQESGRYKKLRKEFHVPSRLRTNVKTGDKQKSFDFEMVHGSFLCSVMRMHFDDCFAYYESLLDDGVCREQARMVLPSALYTSLVYQMDLHNLLKFLRLRTSLSSQFETRQYALAMRSLVEPTCPNVFLAFDK